MNRPVLWVASLALTASLCAHAGDPEAGREKAAPCAACHGVDGNSVNPAWPSLAGQHAGYVIDQLRAYQDGTRQDPMMAPMATGLSEQDMHDLAAYYAAQTPAQLEADLETVELGERIYRGGNQETRVTACIACHGPTGQGNPPAGWPRVAGQHAEYTAAELREYRSGQRTTDMNSIMRDIAQRMTDEEIEAVANYIQGLR